MALSAPIPNLSRNPTICHTSQFSIKLSDISVALSLVIPFICANFCGSYFNTCIVSSPNLFTIFDAVAGPTPFMSPFAKYVSSAPNVLGINFSKVSILNCSPYSLCSTNLPTTFSESPFLINGKYPTTVICSSSVSSIPTK